MWTGKISLILNIFLILFNEVPGNEILNFKYAYTRDVT